MFRSVQFWTKFLISPYVTGTAVTACLFVNIAVHSKLYQTKIQAQSTMDEGFYQKTPNETRLRKSVIAILCGLLALILSYLPYFCFTVVSLASDLNALAL